MQARLRGGRYVQEYDDTQPAPNARGTYLSYVRADAHSDMHSARAHAG